MTETERKLLELFGAKKGFPNVPDEEKLDINYFEAGIVDSFGVIEWIAQVEEAFHMRFDEADFQDRRFANLRGLATIVDNHTRTRQGDLV